MALVTNGETGVSRTTLLLCCVLSRARGPSSVTRSTIWLRRLSDLAEHEKARSIERVRDQR
jgi:hypothetical protein